MRSASEASAGASACLRDRRRTGFSYFLVVARYTVTEDVATRISTSSGLSLTERHACRSSPASRSRGCVTWWSLCSAPKECKVGGVVQLQATSLPLAGGLSSGPVVVNPAPGGRCTTPHALRLPHFAPSRWWTRTNTITMTGHSHHGTACGCDADEHQLLEGTLDFLFEKVDRDRTIALNGAEGVEAKVVIKSWDRRNDETEVRITARRTAERHWHPLTSASRPVPRERCGRAAHSARLVHRDDQDPLHHHQGRPGGAHSGQGQARAPGSSSRMWTDR